ncbi:hypothetical protein G6M87_10990 [Rhizobium rhizogenes]|uniref:hypothetical protein n=1 Tax=Rhizobium rhizogenes TaxID=359 RepID=UPI00157395C9|nr:hypothetical protein [Rhizobium rhizogenes]NTI22383.1 hypothetical protein [Rhizobium rhizogenes]QTG05969.1 hypothetical protein G6M87_10990 [Rhizobium rhizogenes]
MAPRDLKNNIIVNPVLHADVADNTATVGTIQDHRASKSHTYVIHAGTIADADATFTALLEESDASDMSGAVAVDDAYLLGTEALAGFKFDSDNTVKTLGYIGYKRYTRLTITPANNTGAASFSAVCIEEPNVWGTTG